MISEFVLVLDKICLWKSRSSMSSCPTHIAHHGESFQAMGPSFAIALILLDVSFM